MNRYPIWKYVLLILTLLAGLIYSLPNLFGESPAVQISSTKSTVKLDSTSVDRVSKALNAATVSFDRVQFDGTSIKVRLFDADAQLKAKDVLHQEFNPQNEEAVYSVALNLVSKTPTWLSRLRLLIVEPKPMYLGLDLRGGVHFLMQVDMQAVLDKRLDSLLSDIRSSLREKQIRTIRVARLDDGITVALRDQAALSAAQKLLIAEQPELSWATKVQNGEDILVGTLLPKVVSDIQTRALKQNITTLHNRVNELGVAEPIIQQQGLDRIVIQLPGVQDTAKAKSIIGRTANLEFRLADTSPQAYAALEGGPLPLGREKFTVGRGAPVIVMRDIIANGEMLIDAFPRPDENQQPAVSVTLDAKGGRRMRDITRANLGKPMAAILFEKNKGEVLTVATIQGEFGSQFQINGMGTTEAANDLSLLLRAGALAAPMEIIEERTVGPTMGAENIAQGIKSVTYGFVIIALFMCVYYRLFGLFSTLALAFNLLLLVAVLSLIQATLTLPGIAAIALTLGMAIDANVLINERIREELRAKIPPHTAIHIGYEKALATIIDSNITTLIAGLALLAFGSGPIRGFALVHCMGILTSMFSAVMFSRGLVNLWYGRQKRLKSISVGQVWVASESPSKTALV